MTNQPTNWQYDPFVQFRCTIGNQFEILMLIEALEISGIHVISANTDGITALFPKDKEVDYNRVCDEWEVTVGNNVKGKLEFVDYKLFAQKSVNSYIAIKMDGTVKKKSAFATEHLLNKNKSRKVVAIACEAYFTKGIPVEETITNHKNLYDFGIGVKGTRNYEFKMASPNGEVIIYNRILRYYISKEGCMLVKQKTETSESDGYNEIVGEGKDYGKWYCTEFNECPATLPTNIDYSYYIQRAKELIVAMETRPKRGKPTIKDPNQTSLF